MNLHTIDHKQLGFAWLDTSSAQLCKNLKFAQEHDCELNAFHTHRRQQKKSSEQICYDVQRADQGVSKGTTAPLPFH